MQLVRKAGAILADVLIELRHSQAAYCCAAHAARSHTKLQQHYYPDRSTVNLDYNDLRIFQNFLSL